LQNVDLTQLLGDVSAVAAGLRQLVGNPKLAGTVDDLAQSGAELRQLLAQLNQRVGPLGDALQGTLGSARQGAEQWGAAVARVGSAVDRVGQAADRVRAPWAASDRLADDAAPVLASGVARPTTALTAAELRRHQRRQRAAAAVRTRSAGHGARLTRRARPGRPAGTPARGADPWPHA
jgi:uncharacterized protein YukE